MTTMIYVHLGEKKEEKTKKRMMLDDATMMTDEAHAYQGGVNMRWFQNRTLLVCEK